MQPRTKGPAPKVPTNAEWVPIIGRKVATWLHTSGLMVLSAVESVHEAHETPDQAKPSWHVSVSFRGKVATDSQMDMVRHQFQMDGAEEDNHGPGIVRHLWLTVGKASEEECPCKQDEPAQVEDGREWRP